MTSKALCDQLVQGGCRRIRLTSGNGEVLVPANQYPNGKNPDAIKNKVRQICTYLDTLAPDGEYCIEGTIHVKSAWTKYTYIKGTPKVLADPILSNEPDVLSWSAALKMQNELAELRSANTMLRAENDALNEEIDALEEEIQNLNETQMQDGQVQPLMQVAQILPAIVDKWFQQKEESNRLKREELDMFKARQARQQPQNFQDYGPSETL